MKRALTLILSVILLIALLTGCSAVPAGGSGAVPTRTDLNLAIPMSVATFDPYNNVSDPVAVILNNIYEPLYVSKFEKQQGGAVEKKCVPALAESYEVSKDGKVYTFHLRKGVKFHNDAELKASDVVFSLNRANQSPMMQQYTAVIANISASDNNVVITLKDPLASFLQNICQIPIMNEAFVKEAGDKISEKACGTGAYYLSESIPEQKYTLAAYKNYYSGEAKIKKINIKVIPDTTTQVTALESKELDMINVPAANWKQISSSKQYKSYKYIDAASTVVLAINSTREPLNNIKVRQAINYAIDRNSINTICFEGTDDPAYTLAPDFVFGACKPDNPYTYDPKKAKQLLAEAGYPNGFKIASIKTLANEIGKSAQVIQRNFADIGITCEVETLEANALFASFGKGDYDVTLAGLSFPSDYQFYQACLGTDYVTAYNLARYSNKTVDDLFLQAAGELDSAKREAVYKKIVNIVNDDAVYAPIVFLTKRIACDSKLSFDCPVESMTYYDLYWTN